MNLVNCPRRPLTETSETQKSQTHSRGERPDKETQSHMSKSDSHKERDRDREKGDRGDKEKGDKGAVDAPECFIILCDSAAFPLPLEALPYLQTDTLSSVSRDFSLQLFCKRLRIEERTVGIPFTTVLHFSILLNSTNNTNNFQYSKVLFR